jgi:hypothetical protein
MTLPVDGGGVMFGWLPADSTFEARADRTKLFV